MSALIFTVKQVQNGWLVELWRGRNPKEEIVFTDTDAMLQFVEQLARHG